MNDGLEMNICQCYSNVWRKASPAFGPVDDIVVNDKPRNKFSSLDKK